MIWIGGVGGGVSGVSLGYGVGTGAGVGAHVRARGSRGSLEAALSGEWAAFLLVLVGIALVGLVILVITCLGHERAVARRRRAKRGKVASGVGARVGAGASAGVGVGVGMGVAAEGAELGTVAERPRVSGVLGNLSSGGGRSD